MIINDKDYYHDLLNRLDNFSSDTIKLFNDISQILLILILENLLNMSRFSM